LTFFRPRQPFFATPLSFLLFPPDDDCQGKVLVLCPTPRRNSLILARSSGSPIFFRIAERLLPAFLPLDTRRVFLGSSPTQRAPTSSLEESRLLFRHPPPVDFVYEKCPHASVECRCFPHPLFRRSELLPCPLPVFDAPPRFWVTSLFFFILRLSRPVFSRAQTHLSVPKRPEFLPIFPRPFPIFPLVLRSSAVDRCGRVPTSVP